MVDGAETLTQIVEDRLQPSIITEVFDQRPPKQQRSTALSPLTQVREERLQASVITYRAPISA